MARLGTHIGNAPAQMIPALCRSRDEEAMNASTAERVPGGRGGAPGGRCRVSKSDAWRALMQPVSVMARQRFGRSRQISSSVAL